MTAEELFLKKYGNKITASESWVIRFAEEYYQKKSAEIPENCPYGHKDPEFCRTLSECNYITCKKCNL